VLEHNNTWIVTDYLIIRNPLDANGCIRSNTRLDESLKCYKARPVAKGYNQLEE